MPVPHIAVRTFTSGPQTRQLDVYLDLVSPYSYLAFVRLRDHFKPKYGSKLRIVYRPIVFGAILKRHGHLGPGEIPPKRQAMLNDLARTASKHGLRMGWPKLHPFNSLHALRLVSLPAGYPLQEPLISLFFDGAFGPSTLGCYDLSPEDCRGLIDGAVKDGRLPKDTPREPTQDMKDRLRRATEEAIERGVFGVPSFVAEGMNEVIWGNDALDGA